MVLAIGNDQVRELHAFMRECARRQGALMLPGLDTTTSKVRAFMHWFLGGFIFLESKLLGSQNSEIESADLECALYLLTSGLSAQDRREISLAHHHCLKRIKKIFVMEHHVPPIPEETSTAASTPPALRLGVVIFSLLVLGEDVWFNIIMGAVAIYEFILFFLNAMTAATSLRAGGFYIKEYVTPYEDAMIVHERYYYACNVHARACTD